MKFNKYIHGYAQLIKSLIGTIEFGLTKPKNRLFVLNFHGTPKEFISDFENLLDVLQTQFEIISPDTFFSLMRSEERKTNNQLLLTFDDGLKNNLHALEILDKRNLSALLFIVPGFIDSVNPSEYYKKNIRPEINPLIDHEAEDVSPLTWQDLKSIAHKHRIGSHTMNHILTMNTSDLAIIKEEIVDSKEILESKLDCKINSFCSINNTLLSVNSQIKKVIAEHYDFHFTTIAGCNNNNRNPQFIKRINMECFWLPGAIKFSVGNFNLERQKSKVKAYDLV